VPARDPGSQAHQLDGVVLNLQQGDRRSVADLFELLSSGAHFFVRRTVGDSPENAEIVRRVLLEAAQAALDGRIRDGAEMSNYVLTTIRELPSNGQDPVRVATDNFESPENMHSMSEIVSLLPARDREVVRRFYALGQSRSESARTCA